MRSVTILLAIKNMAFHNALAEFIQAFPGLHLRGQCATIGDSLIDAVCAHMPDLVLTDWPLNGGLFTAHTGLEGCVRHIRELCPRTRAVLLAPEVNSDYRAAARVAGLDAVISRGEVAVQLPLLIDELFR